MSNPLKPGIRTSVMIMAKDFVITFPNAYVPFSTDSASYPSSSITSFNRDLISSSSSIINIRFLLSSIATDPEKVTSLSETNPHDVDCLPLLFSFETPDHRLTKPVSRLSFSETLPSLFPQPACQKKRSLSRGFGKGE